MNGQRSMSWLVLCMMALACTARAHAADGDDQFRERSVWVNDDKRMTLKVIERDGDSFKARFCIGDGIERVVTGKVKDGKLDWRGKDVRAIKGGAGGDNHGTFVDADTIKFVWLDDDGANGSFTLCRR
jgi:hypothetical protein